jgi:hypothetical protein
MLIQLAFVLETLKTIVFSTVSPTGIQDSESMQLFPAEAEPI